MVLPGAPDFTKRLYANAAFKVTDFKTSWETWLEVYNTATDDRVKKIASNHLYQVKAEMDVDALKEAVTKFKEKYSRLPEELPRLVTAGILASLPKDLDGQDYVYDAATGDVKPPTMWWKR
jgi:hypothetical protein